MAKPPVGFSWNLVRNRAGPRHVGAPSNRYYLNFFGLQQGWRTFFRARAQISDKFWRNSFVCGKPEFTSTKFTIFQWSLCLPAPNLPFSSEVFVYQHQISHFPVKSLFTSTKFPIIQWSLCLPAPNFPFSSEVFVYQHQISHFPLKSLFTRTKFPIFQWSLCLPAPNFPFSSEVFTKMFLSDAAFLKTAQ